MKTVKRLPLKDLRENRGLPNKSARLIRLYQKSKVSNQSRHRKHVLATNRKMTNQRSQLPTKKLQPYVRLTRLNESLPGLSTSMSVPLKPEEVRPEELAMMRSLIGSLLFYPNLLGHDDFLCLRKLLEHLGVICKWDTTAIHVPLEPSLDTTLIKLHPPKGKNNVPFLFSFGFIREMEIDEVTRSACISQYSLMPSMCQALRKVVSSVYTSPKILYEETHIFLYEFLVHFGVKPKSVEELVKPPRRTSRMTSTKKLPK